MGSPDFPDVGPAGGSQRAAVQDAVTSGRTTPYFNTYIETHDALPGCHVDPTIATMMCTWQYDTDTLGKRHYFQSLISDHSDKGIAQRIPGRTSVYRVESGRQ